MVLDTENYLHVECLILHWMNINVYIIEIPYLGCYCSMFTDMTFYLACYLIVYTKYM